MILSLQYFRGKKIHTDWDLRVEQAEFKELTVKQFQNPPKFCSDYFEKFKMFVQVMANSESGVTVCLPVARGGKLR